MNKKYILTHNMVDAMVQALANKILKFYGSTDFKIKVFPIPRGGVPVAYLLKSKLPNLKIVDDPAKADIFIDDIYDSGATCQKWCDLLPGRPFFVLVDKSQPAEHNDFKDKWICFPWENANGQDDSATDNVVRLLQYVGQDPSREGLLDTPKRFLKALEHHCSGYHLKAEDLLKTFDDGAECCDEMIVRKDIPIYSRCEHHLEAIFGKCTIAYIPNGKIVGLSKMDRLADMFARRLQVQERMTNQIADAMFDILQPKGVGVWINARHMCVESRGVMNQNSDTITCALRGIFKTQPETRNEFLAMARV